MQSKKQNAQQVYTVYTEKKEKKIFLYKEDRTKRPATTHSQTGSSG